SSWGKTQDGGIQIDAFVDAHLWRERGRRIVQHDSRFAPPRRPHFVEYDIDGQPVQPCREGALFAKTAYALPGADEHILDTLGGDLGITSQSETQPVRTSDMAPVQRLKRVEVTALHTAHQRHVVQLRASLAGLGHIDRT